MADESNLTNMPDRSFENQLRNLAPAPTRLDRDALMFAAGRAGVSRSPRLAWPLATAALALIAAGEGLVLTRRTPPQVIERLVVVRETEPTPMPAAVADTPERPRSIRPPRTSTPLTPYQRLSRQLALYGLDALPSPPRPTFAAAEPRATPSSSSADLLRDEIDLILNPGDPT